MAESANSAIGWRWPLLLARSQGKGSERQPVTHDFTALSRDAMSDPWRRHLVADLDDMIFGEPLQDSAAKTPLCLVVAITR